MPSAKTECTELSVGFGLLRIDPIGLSQTKVDQYFDSTLTSKKYKIFVQEFGRDENYYRQFYAVGMELRSSFRPFANIMSIRWEGPRQQARSVLIAKDLVAANIAISVKANSNVVFNPSPYNLFVSLPKGHTVPSKTDNWYLMVSPQLHQNLYSYIRDRCDENLPSQAIDYYKIFRDKERRHYAKQFAKIIKGLPEWKTEEFLELYRSFCYDISQKSAQMFNDALASTESNIRDAITGDFIRNFFRIGDSEYILCGMDKGKDFAVRIPDLTSWKRDWRLKKIEAVPIDCGQSEVGFKLTVTSRIERKEYDFNYHTEIRWSHGKFCGNPEAKLYKEFAWADVQFFEKVYESSGVRKLGCIGAGGFGTVYEAYYEKNPKEKVAVKEFKISEISLEEKRRFEREVTFQSRLDHPNILSVIESGLSAKTPWFTMPLANCSLAEVVGDLPGDYQRIDKIFRQILEGIRYAHHQKVIHRDLKPENVLLFDNEQVKISDFGLCKPLDPNELSAVLTHTSNNAMGTLPYAAPEQLESFRDADHRSDIYALGKTLMHMTTGKVPPITPTDLDSVDIRYRSFINRCIQQNPASRFQQIDEVIEAFDEISSFHRSSQLTLHL